MNTAETAFRVAFSLLGAEQAKRIIRRPRGTHQLKTVVLQAAIASAMRQVIDSNEVRVLVDARYFYDVEDYIRTHFSNILAAMISKLGTDEVNATCELCIFQPQDKIIIAGEGIKGKIELSIERLVYKTLLLALEDYMERDNVNINMLVIALDAVHDATKNACINATKIATIIQGGNKLG